MFVEGIKQQIKDKLQGNINKDGSPKNIEDMEVIQTYASIVRWNNVFISLMGVVLGAIAFCIMGYLVQTGLKNSTFYFSVLLNVIVSGIAINIILWGIKSIFAFAIWRGLIQKDGDTDVMFPFFTIEGMSDLAFLVVLPFFFVMNLITSVYFATLVIGAGLALKYALMYLTYPVFYRELTKADKVILIISSIGSLVLLKLFIDVFIIGT